MDTSENNVSHSANQFLCSGKSFEPTEVENSVLFQQPETGRQSIPPQFRLPFTTDRQSVPPLFQPPSTDRQSVPPLFQLPTTGRQTALSTPLETPRVSLLSYKYHVPVTTVPTQPLPPEMLSKPQVAAPIPPKRGSSKLDNGMPFIAVIFNILVIVAILWLSQNKPFLPTATKKSASPTHGGITTPALNSITNNKTISPLIFGTNMALFHDYDEPILTSEATRQQLKNVGVRVIRMPTRTSLKPETEVKAAQAIKEIGAVPLVVINGPEFKGGPLLESDQNTLNLLMPVFGNEPVYFEFGNESDLNGVNAQQYATAWNQVIPALKEMFPNARFIAPDNYQFTRRYLKTFLQLADPRPDGVSWHEYTCSVNWTAAFCLSILDTWPIHFAQARAAMREAIGTELPIWITEWNYASDQQVNNGQPVADSKYNNPTFIQEWTTKAMNLLIENRIFASMQYFATDLPMPLVTHNQIGSEGTLFQQEYKKVMVQGYTPPQMTISEVPATPPKNANLTFSFKDGTVDGWSIIGGGITPPVISTARAFVGTQSMKITLSNASEDTFPILGVSRNQLPTIPGAGQMISAYIYVDNKAALVNAKVFVSDSNNAFHYSGEITLTSGQWNKVWYALPSNFNNQVAGVGIQFYTSRPGVSSDVYIGGVDWTSK